MSDKIGDFPGVGRLVTPIKTAEYATPGTYKWACPIDVYLVWVTAVASGGGGAALDASYKGGGGGGGEGVFWFPIVVTPGTTYTIIVGALAAVNVDGNPTSFGSLLSLQGGRKGPAPTVNSLGGNGGGAGGGIGSVNMGAYAVGITGCHECGASGGGGSTPKIGGPSSFYLGGLASGGAGGGASLLGPGGNGSATVGLAPASGYGGGGAGGAANQVGGSSAAGYMKLMYYSF